MFSLLISIPKSAVPTAISASAICGWGHVVEVRANQGNGNKLIAERIELEENIQIKGFIQNVDTVSSGLNSLMINDILVFVNSSTEIRSHHDTNLSFSDLQIGDLVELRADLQGNNTYLATRIERENSEDDQDELLRVRGIIEALGQDSLVVNGIDFFIDEKTEFRDDLGNRLTFADFQIGDPVEVRAVQRPGSTLLATRVKLRNNEQNEIEFTAPIDTLFSSSLIVGGITFDTDDNTVILNDNNQPITLDDLQIGMIVEIRGLRKVDGHILATHIKIEDFFQDELEVKGTIDSLGIDYLAVLGHIFFVNENTIVLDNNNSPISFPDLSIGLLVEVRANRLADGSLLATRIKLEDTENDELEITGVIDTLNTGFIRVEGIDFVTNENTLILDHANNPIAFSDLIAGLTVEIKASRQPDDAFLAVRIKIEDGPGFSSTDGIVSSVSPNTIVVAEPEFLVTATTVVLDEKFRQISYSEIAVGQEVTLWSDASNGRLPLALQIKINKSGNLTGISAGTESTPVADRFQLDQNYPNPFNPSTMIPFRINAAQFERVELTIFNILGQQVRTLFNGVLDSGAYEFLWDGRNNHGIQLPSGVYFYQLSADSKVIASKRMMLLK